MDFEGLKLLFCVAAFGWIVYMAFKQQCAVYNYNRQDQDTQKRPHKSSHLANPFFFHCPFPPLKNRYFLLHTAGNLPLFFVCF